LQAQQQEWPATAGVSFMEHSALAALDKQSCWKGYDPADIEN